MEAVLHSSRLLPSMVMSSYIYIYTHLPNTSIELWVNGMGGKVILPFDKQPHKWSCVYTELTHWGKNAKCWWKLDPTPAGQRPWHKSVQNLQTWHYTVQCLVDTVIREIFVLNFFICKFFVFKYFVGCGNPPQLNTQTVFCRYLIGEL